MIDKISYGGERTKEKEFNQCTIATVEHVNHHCGISFPFFDYINRYQRKKSLQLQFVKSLNLHVFNQKITKF